MDGIDVSNPSDLFEFLEQHCVEDGFLNEFTHILQCLTTIPRNAPYLWSTVEKIVSYSTAPIRKTQLNDMMKSNDTNLDEDLKERLEQDLFDLEADPEDAFPTFDQLKVMLSRYDLDLAYMESESTHYKEQIGLLQEQILNLKYQLSNRQQSYDQLAKENKKLKHRSMTADLITVDRKDFDDVLNNKNTKASKTKTKTKHKRKSSLLDKIGITGIFKSNTNLTATDALYDVDDDEDEDEDEFIDVSKAWQTMNLSSNENYVTAGAGSGSGSGSELLKQLNHHIH